MEMSERFILNILFTGISAQIIPDETDYTNFPNPFSNIEPGQFSLQNRQSAFMWGTCKVVYNQ